MAQELVSFVARALVDEPEAVRVDVHERDGVVVYSLTVAAADRGKVIGRGGRVIRALRTVVRASGTKSGERRLLELAE